MSFSRFSIHFCFCLIVLFVSSCVATSGVMRTNTIAASGVSPSDFRTFSWYQEQPVAEAEYIKGFDADLNQHIRKAVEEELKQKGYRMVTSNPDILVAYDVSVSVPLEKDNPENFAPGFGYSYGYMSGYRYDYDNAGMPGYRAVDLFKEGTLIIDFVKPVSKDLLWRGWTEGAISNFNASYSKVHQRVEEVLNKL